MIEKRMKEINDRKLEIRKMLEGDNELNLDEIQQELEGLETEQRSLQNKLDMANKINANEIEVRQIQKPNTEERNMENILETMEYRKSFMNYALKGQDIPGEYRNAVTMTSDVGAVIPTHLMNQIIEKLRFYGNIFKRVTITNYQGGVEIPLGDAKPTATWTNEGTVSGKQKKVVDATVSFKYHKLQCRVAVTLEASVTTLSVFEQTVVDNIYEAMIIAIEEAILNGTGVKQPLGITKDPRVLATQKINVKPSELKTWDKWSKIFAKVPLTKRNGISLIINSETYEGDILGMIDADGQPVARVTYGLDGSESYRFKGKEVLPVELYLKPYEVATAGEVFGVICNLKDYMINSNLAMTFKRYFDEDTDEYVNKSTTIIDGCLADAQGVILLVKAAE